MHFHELPRSPKVLLIVSVEQQRAVFCVRVALSLGADWPVSKLRPRKSHGSGSVGVIKDEDARLGDKDSENTISEGRRHIETTNENQ